MALSFTRKVNISPGIQGSGDIVDAAHINELQVALEGITTGTQPIPLAGIEGALDTRVIATNAAQPTARQTLRPRISDLKPRWVDSPNFFGRDYVSGDRAENASPGLASLIAATRGSWTTERCSGAHISLESGEYTLTETLDLTLWTGIIDGAGVGPSPGYALHPGNGTVFRWDGPAGEPVIRVRDSRDVQLKNFRIEGKDGTLASYGIEFYREVGDDRGTNQFLLVQDVHIGRYPWTQQGTNKGIVTSGIGFTGDNGNNDQWRLERVNVCYPSEYGLYVKNFNSVAGTARNLMVQGAGVAGVSTGACLHLSDPEFFGCATDIITHGPQADVWVTNIYSEDTHRLAALSYDSMFAIHGGRVQLDLIESNGEVMISASPCDKQTIALHDIFFTPYSNPFTDPTKCRIEIGPKSPHVGRFILDVKRCQGLKPAQVAFGSGASMWASSSMSKGVVDWQSIYTSSLYQFRNELRHSSHPLNGTGTRTSLDYSAWDMPVTD